MQYKLRIRRQHVLIAVALGIVTLAMPIATGHVPFGASDDGDARTIVIIAKDMRFNETNPTFNVLPGEMIRIILRNQDPGMKHDFTIPALDLRTPVVELGEEAVLFFRVPELGTLEYLCSMHPVSMKGLFQIGDPAGSQLSATQ
jgi:plastocyanin